MSSSDKESESVVRILPIQRQTSTVIFLHGLGQSNRTWQLVVSEALAPRLPGTEWILPQSSMKPVTHSGRLRPSWFNIGQLPPDPNEYDEAAIAASSSTIENIILSEVHKGIDSSRIVLVGFSQGAALSLIVALSTLHELGGVVSLSGWIPQRARESLMNNNVRILWCHGTTDDEIPLQYAEESIAYLRSTLGTSHKYFTLKTYEGLAHEINTEEMEDLAAWLERVLE